MSGPLNMALIVAKRAKKPGAPDGDEPKDQGEETDVGLEAAAEEVLSAVEAKDPKALAAALRSAVTMCSK